MAAVITAIGAVIVTIFTWLQGRDYGKTVRDMIAPVNTALQQTSASMTETKSLFDRFMDRQSGELSRLANEQATALRMLERLDVRTSKIDGLL